MISGNNCRLLSPLPRITSDAAGDWLISGLSYLIVFTPSLRLVVYFTANWLNSSQVSGSDCMLFLENVAEAHGPGDL